MIRIDTLPLDLTGTSQTNLIVNEIHELIDVGNKTNRVVLPKEGMFYVSGLSVRENTSGRVLRRNVDYKFGYHVKGYSFITGLDIQALIIVTNPSITDSIRISYQALGGDSNVLRDRLRDLLQVISDNSIDHNFKDIIGLPEGFPGDANHPHKYWQIYGWDSLLENMELIIVSIDDWTREGILSAIREYYTDQVARMDRFVGLYEGYMGHLQNMDNPHNLHKDQIGLNELHNWRIVPYQDAANKAIDTQYAGINGVVAMIERWLRPALDEHLADMDNPHEATLATLDLKSTADLTDLFKDRLLKTSAAESSRLFNGLTPARFATDATTNLNASEVRNYTKFPASYFQTAARPGNLTNLVLCSDGVFRDIFELGKNYRYLRYRRQLIPGVAATLNAAWNEMINVGRNVPDQTILIKHWRRNTGDWDGSRPESDYSQGEIYEVLLAMKDSELEGEYVQGLYPLYNLTHT